MAQALPITLFYIRTRPRWDMGISPFKLLFGRPPDNLKGLDPHSLNLERGDMVLSAYFTALHQRLRTLWKQSALTHRLCPWRRPYTHSSQETGCARTTALQPRWKGPFQVLPTTQTAIKVAEKDAWIHWTYVKPAVFDHSKDPATEQKVPHIRLQKDPDTNKWALKILFEVTRWEGRLWGNWEWELLKFVLYLHA